MISKTQNKKGAMEMSVGTIVTIVLLMSVLVLGIFLVQEIFSTSSNAIDQVNDQVQSQINELFSSGDQDLVILPPSKRIGVVKGETPPAGFAFSIRNPSDSSSQTFTYEVSPTDMSQCSQISEEDVTSWMLGASGEVELGPSQSMGSARKVAFSIPEGTQECSFATTIQVTGDQGYSDSRQIFVSIESGGGLF